MKRHLLTRREFNARCAALGLALPAAGGLFAASSTARTVTFPDGTAVPALGQGTWHLGQGRHPAEVEQEALRTGLSLGMTLVDTSGNYGNGRSEELIRHVLDGMRDRIYLVSKVETSQLSGDGVAQACAASLARLGTPYLDLYLLHWPSPASTFPAAVAAFERLRAAGKIRAWGVSNFSVAQMEALFRVPDGQRCATNQVPYSLNNRRIERDVLPWCAAHRMPVMAYSPLGGDNNLLVGNATLAQLAGAHGCSAAAVALAWVMREGNVIAIPESGSPAHVRENAVALTLTLAPAERAQLDAAFPGPSG